MVNELKTDEQSDICVPAKQLDELILLKKSAQNKLAADLLIDNKLYNAAANRRYYSLFQKAVHILISKGFSSELKKLEDKFGSHVATIKLLKKEVLATRNDKKAMQIFYDIREKRNDCDYKLYFIEEKDVYDLEISQKANKIERILLKYSS